MRTLAFQVLRELSDLRFVSGTALAERLGVSRSTISDALIDATAHGVNIFKLTRRGYRLAAPLDLLDVDTLRDHLGDAVRRVDVDIVETIDSSNSALIERAAAGATSGSCIAAEIQTDGRGRRGRNWKSGLATSLTFSLLWRFDRGAAQLGGLSLAVGLAIVRALRHMGVRNAGLKWPNDIVVGGKKLGGILIETQGDMLGPVAVVIGVGINVNLPEALIAEIDQPVTDIRSQMTQGIPRNVLLAEVLRQLVTLLEQFDKTGFAPFHDEWVACHALHGHDVVVMRDHGNFFEAVVRDVAPDGALIVESEGRRTVLSSGEISVRPVPKNTKRVAATPFDLKKKPTS